MCFYPYCPGKYISIRVASETLVLRKHGGRVVVADILVQNDTPITDNPDPCIPFLYILYEDRFSKPVLPLRRDTTTDLEFLEVGEFSEKSATLIDPDDPLNEHYRNGTKITATDIGANTTEITISEPDPRQPSRFNEFRGTICAEDKLEGPPCPGGAAETQLALSLLNFSVFTYYFHAPIQPGEAGARWIRLYISPPPRQWADSQRLRHCIDYLFDSLYARYEIFAPHDVYHSFMTKLAVLRQVSKEEGSEQLYNVSDSLYKALLPEPEEDASGHPHHVTKVLDWRLHATPRDACEIYNMHYSGDVEPAGRLPNMVNEDGHTSYWYEWKTQSQHDNVHCRAGTPSFRIAFGTRRRTYHIPLLGLLGFVLGLIAFVRTLL